MSMKTMYLTGDLARPIYAAEWRGYAAPSSRRSGPALGAYEDLSLDFLPSLSNMEKTALLVGAAGLGLWYVMKRRKKGKRR